SVPLTALKIIPSLTGGFVISSPAHFNRRLEIFNTLSRKVADEVVLAGSLSLDHRISSLPPGCYFARLGDEVAKFIVPPR
ncbi:MAG TPA: hypothetical protein VFX22_11215, partial [Candidatus Kapabacteria bacterium]|nr:hypothetical protein [Candidatus Kapabacteria bacterium]